MGHVASVACPETEDHLLHTDTLLTRKVGQTEDLIEIKMSYIYTAPQQSYVKPLHKYRYSRLKFPGSIQQRLEPDTHLVAGGLLVAVYGGNMERPPGWLHLLHDEDIIEPVSRH